MTKSRGILPPRQYWQPQELELLRSMYPDCHAADVAVWLERKVSQVHAAAARHGLHKSPEFIAGDTACRIQRGKHSEAMKATQFQPGSTPWNRGTHYVAGGRSAETRFKKGQRPKTYVPVGALRVNSEGYLDRKTSEKKGAMAWEAVHRLVWKEAGREIPPGHVVVFKPGMFSNVLEEITLARLECISRRELVWRNHPIRRSPDYAKLVALKAAINRQVNRIQREQTQ